METTTTCGDPWAEESAYAAWFPRVVLAAHRITRESDLIWPPKSSAFLLMVKRGCDAADVYLQALRRRSPELWAGLNRDDRVRRAVFVATLAMARHVRTVVAPR